MIRYFSSLTLAILCSLIAYAQRPKADWDVYVTKTKDKLTSVMTNLGLREAAPMPDKPIVLILRVDLRTDDGQGFPKAEEVRVLDRLEDSLVLHLEKQLSAIYAGRYTSSRRRDFYFYTDDTLHAGRIVDELLRQGSGYAYTLDKRSDPGWTYYADVLYPTPRLMESIQNRRVVDRLVELGDVLERPRTVTHVIYFKTENGRKAFANEMMKEKFIIDGFADEKGIADRPFLIKISRTDKVTLESIDPIAVHVWEMALKFNGRYDGWECAVVKK